MDTKEKIRNYITDNLIFAQDDSAIEDDVSLLEAGIMDSVAVMELVLFVEEEFQLEIDDNEIIPENFDSISNLSNFIHAKLA